MPIVKTISKGELQNVKVGLVSLLFDEMTPANQAGYVVKSAQGGQFKHVVSTAKVKSETEGSQGRLYVTLMEPGKKDAQGDFYQPAEIEKACEHFARTGMVGRNDINHNMHPVDEFFVAENYILKAADAAHFPDTALGSWVQVIKCLNLESDLWQKVIKRQFNGVSIYGKAEDLGDTMLTKTLENVQKALENLSKSNDPEAKKAVGELQAQLTELQKAGVGQNNVVLKGIESGLQKMNDSLTRAISKSLQGEPWAGASADREVLIDNQKVVVKGSHKDIYKGIAQVGTQVAPMNILTANTSSLFIDEVVGSNPSDTLTDISVIPLIKDELIDVGQVSDITFTNQLNPPVAAQEIGTSELACPTGILLAEIKLSKDTMEFYRDKHGEDAFGAYIEQKIASKAEKAIRKLLFQGDTTSSTAALKALNGIIKQATTASAVTEISKATYATWAARLEQVLLGFSDDMLEEQENFVIYVNHKDLIMLRNELANRATNAGDRLLLEGGNVSFAGIPLKGRLIPQGYVIAGLPKFIILGYRTDTEMYWTLENWKYVCHIRLRAGFTHVPGFVKIYQVVA